MNESRKRGEILTVRLRPDFVSRLESLADRRGIPASTLASLVLGEYIDRVEASERYQEKAFVEAIRSIARDLAPTSGVLEELSREVVARVESALTSVDNAS